MRMAVLGLSLALFVGHAAFSSAADTSRTTLDLWPGKAPGEVGIIGAEKAKIVAQPDGTKVVASLTNVSKPTLTVCPPTAEKNTGTAIVVFPGGGYTNLAWDHEGEQVARWLNSIGVTAALLKYRVPRREGTSKDTPPIQALMDAQRAVSLVRSNAEKWGINPKLIGVLGFSAGGHLSAWTATSFHQRAYERVDAADDASCRPDFAAIIYPGYISRRDTHQFAPEIHVTPDTPSCFLVHADDDHVASSESSIAMYMALKKAGVSAEMHIYAVGGGHGFGVRPTGKTSATWPQRCEEWMRSIKVLTAAGK